MLWDVNPLIRLCLLGLGPALLVGLAGCKRPGPRAADAGSRDAAPPVVEAPAAPPPPAGPQPLPGLGAQAVLAGGSPFPLDEQPIPVDARFEVEIARPMADLRVALHDERGRLVPSTDDVWIGGRTRVSLKPMAPLTPNARYSLLIGGEGSEAPKDRDGTVYQAAPLSFKTAPDPSRLSTTPQKQKKHRKHRR